MANKLLISNTQPLMQPIITLHELEVDIVKSKKSIPNCVSINYVSVIMSLPKSKIKNLQHPPPFYQHEKSSNLQS